MTRRGKIVSISLGYGGYQDAMFGISTTLGGPAWGVDDFNGYWATERDNHCRWTEKDREESFIKMLWWIKALLDDAKVTSLAALQGSPIEATFKDNRLESWRIMSEVL